MSGQAKESGRRGALRSKKRERLLTVVSTIAKIRKAEGKVVSQRISDT